jgi:hypothetical protein
VIHFIEGNDDHAHECNVGALLDLDFVGVKSEDMSHQCRLALDPTDDIPPKRYIVEFRPPISAHSADERFAAVYIGIAIREILNPERGRISYGVRIRAR